MRKIIVLIVLIVLLLPITLGITPQGVFNFRDYYNLTNVLYFNGTSIFQGANQVLDASGFNAGNLTGGTIDNARITLVQDEVPDLTGTWSNVLNCTKIVGNGSDVNFCADSTTAGDANKWTWDGLNHSGIDFITSFNATINQSIWDAVLDNLANTRQCSGTDKVKNITVNSSGAYILCAADEDTTIKNDTTRVNLIIDNYIPNNITTVNSRFANTTNLTSVTGYVDDNFTTHQSFIHPNATHADTCSIFDGLPSNAYYAYGGISANNITLGELPDIRISDDITIATTKPLNTTKDFNVNLKFNVSASDGNTYFGGNLTLLGSKIYENGSHIFWD